MNKNNLIKILLFLGFGISLFSTNVFAEPTFTNNITSIPNNTEYNTNNVYYFYINWTESPQNVTFETNITNTTSTNYTLISYTSLKVYENTTNDTHRFYINFTINQTRGAENYVYRWFASNTTGTENVSDQWVYTIAQAPTEISLWLNNTENNYTYYQNEWANFTAQLNVSGKTIKLNSSYPGWSEISNDTVIYNLTQLNTLRNDFNLTAYWDGDENYFFDSKTYFFNVTDLNWSENSTNPNSSINYSPNANYSFSIKWVGSISSVIFEADFLDGNRTYTNNNSTTHKNITINNNAQGIYWINFTDLSGGTYRYRWFANDTNDVWISTDQCTYIVSSIPVILTLWSNSWNVTAPETVTASCSATDLDFLNLTLSIDGHPQYDVGSVINTTIYSSSGTHYYVCYFGEGNSNYSANSTTKYLNVNAPQTSGGALTITNLASSITVNAGESNTTTFNIKNTYDFDISNISISVIGIPSDWYSLSKNLIDKLKNNTFETIKITFNISENAEAKNYLLTLNASGKTVSTTQKMTLTVRPAVELEVLTNVTNVTNVTQSVTGGPTGFTLRPVDFAYVIAVIGIISSILIFVGRYRITNALMKMRKGKSFKPSKPKKRLSFLRSKISIKLKKTKA